MANLAGGDTYFSGTLRDDAWKAFEEAQREAAIREAGSMVNRLAFLRNPPAESIDNAAYEQAYCLLEQQSTGASEAAQAIAQGVKSRSIADSSESYTTAAERDKDPGWINGVFYCPKALSWLSGYLGTAVRRGSYQMRDWW